MNKIIVQILVKSADHSFDAVNIATAIVEGLIENSSLDRNAVLDIIRFLNNKECPYCKRAPEVMAAQEKEETKIYQHMMLEKAPEPEFAETTIAQTGVGYNAGICGFIMIKLLQHGL